MSSIAVDVPVDYAPDSLERVAVKRVASVLARIAHLVSSERLEEIVSSSSDAEVMLRLIEEGGPEVLALLSEADPLAQARLRGTRAKRKLLEEGGGTLGAGRVAEVLGISRQAVDKRRQSVALLAVNAGDRFVFPAWQFEGGQAIAGLKRVLRSFDIDDPWMQLSFFLTANPRLGDRRPLDLLGEGVVDPVCDAAAAYTRHGAA